MRLVPLASLLAASMALSACGSTGVSLPRYGAQPLPAQPTAPVAAVPLPPPVETAPTAPVEVAVAQPTIDPATAGEVRLADLSGGWNINSAGESCKLFMGLTSWSGGYRANTRGCASDELKAVSAWNLNGKEIQLKDASGSTVARLYSSGEGRFSGQTEVSKRGVQFSR